MSLIAFRTDTSLRGTVISNHTARSAGTAFSKVDMGGPVLGAKAKDVWGRMQFSW
jgi:hypothetical protein